MQGIGWLQGERPELGDAWRDPSASTGGWRRRAEDLVQRQKAQPSIIRVIQGMRQQEKSELVPSWQLWLHGSDMIQGTYKGCGAGLLGNAWEQQLTLAERLLCARHSWNAFCLMCIHLFSPHCHPVRQRVSFPSFNECVNWGTERLNNLCRVHNEQSRNSDLGRGEKNEGNLASLVEAQVEVPGRKPHGNLK